MIRSLRLALTAFGALFVFGGCIQFESAVTLMPDGSGKMALTFGVSPEFAKLPSNPDLNFSDPEKLEKVLPGFAAFTKPVETVKDGWSFITMTAYFDDIAKVKVGEIDSFEFKRTETGFTLNVNSQLSRALGAPGKSVAADKEKAREALRKFTKGFRYALKITAPGTLLAADGWVKEGRTASLVIDERLLDDALAGKETGEIEALRKAKSISWKQADLKDEEIEAFKKELAQAKFEWKFHKALMANTPKWKKK